MENLKISLSMPGGGARYAYLGSVLEGILKVMTNELDVKVEIDSVSGTSAGAINSFFMALGYEPQEIIAIQTELTPKQMVNSRLGVLGNGALLKALLQKKVKEKITQL